MADPNLLGRESVLITGLEGSGKSHYVVSQVKKMLDEGFTNTIYLCNLTGVTLQAPNLVICDQNFDWTKAEDNSVVIYDEAGTIERFSNLHNKLYCDELKMISQRRKTGVLLVFIAQDSQMINSAMRKLLKFHFHFTNPYNDGKKTHCFIFAGVMSQLSTDNKSWHGKAIEQFDHELNPDIFPLYQSINQTANHNKKKQKNKKAQTLFMMAAGAVVLSIILFGVGIKLARNYYATNLDADKVQSKIDGKPVASAVSATAQNVASSVVPASAVSAMASAPVSEREQAMNEQYKRTLELYQQRLPDDYQILVSNNDLRIHGVMSFRGKCFAYNQYGERLEVPQRICRDQYNGGMIKAHTNTLQGVTQYPTDAQVNQPENLQPGLNQPPEKPTQQGEQQTQQQNLPVQQNITPVHSVAG